MKKNIFILTMLLLSACGLNGYKNYIKNSSGKMVRLRVRYGANNGTGVYLLTSQDKNTEFFILKPDDIVEIIAEENYGWLNAHNPLKIRAAELKDTLKLDIDTQSGQPTASSQENKPKMAAVDVDLKDLGKDVIFVVDIKYNPQSSKNLKLELQFIKAHTLDLKNISSETPYYNINLVFPALNSLIPQTNRDRALSTKEVTYREIIKNLKDDKETSLKNSGNRKSAVYESMG